MKVRIPKSCLLTVYPLDPHRHDWTYALVDMHVVGECAKNRVSNECATQATESFEARVFSDAEPGRNFLQIEAPPESNSHAVARSVHRLRSWLIGGSSSSSSSSSVSKASEYSSDKPTIDDMHSGSEKTGLYDCQVALHIGIPGRFDLDIEVAHGSVTLTDTFEGDVKIYSSSADIIANRLKSMYVDIDVSDDGDVCMNAVQGNLSLRSNHGLIDIGKVQGPAVRMITESSDVQVRALYADYSMIRSRDGTVRLGGAQGYTKIRTNEGNVEVAGADGRLDIESDCGDIEANLVVPKTVSMRSRKGDIAVGLPDHMVGNVLFEGGNQLNIDSDVDLIVDQHLTADDDSNSSSSPSDLPLSQGIVKGHVGVSQDDVSDDQFASVHARAPTGDVCVARQSWGAMLYGNGEKKKFPRWIQNES